MRNRGSVHECSTPLGLVAAGIVLMMGCAGQEEQPVVSAASAPQTPPPAAPAPAAAPAPVAATPAPPAAPTAKQALVVADAGFSSPESAIHDADQDVYFVSNVNGEPLAKDDNGFISRVGPDGKVIALKWLDGTKPKITLNAPKGMGISGSFLYVADINVLRIFDRKTGAPRGELSVKGASFLNDVAVDKDGVVYVTDTGWKAGAKEGLENSGTDAVFKIDPKVVALKLIVQNKELGNPNGLAANAEGLWTVTAAGKLYRVTADGKREQEGTLPGKGLDGLVALDNGDMLASSWETSTVYIGKPGGTFAPLAADLKSPAGIGYDSKRGRLLVPQFSENKLAIYDMPGNAELLAKAEAQPAPAGDASSPRAGEKPAMTPASGSASAAAPKASQAQSKPASTPAQSATQAQLPASKGAAPAPAKVAEPGKSPEPAKAGTTPSPKPATPPVAPQKAPASLPGSAK